MHTREDLETLELRLDGLFTKDSDLWAAGAAFVLEKPVADVTKDERWLFKHAFLRAFQLHGKRLVIGNLDYVDRLVTELRKRGIFQDVDRVIAAQMRAEEERPTP